MIIVNSQVRNRDRSITHHGYSSVCVKVVSRNGKRREVHISAAASYVENRVEHSKSRMLHPRGDFGRRLDRYRKWAS